MRHPPVSNFSPLGNISERLHGTDLLRFGRGGSVAAGAVLHCHLQEGEALFIPIYWWHMVHSRSTRPGQLNVAVNLWWKSHSSLLDRFFAASLDYHMQMQADLTGPANAEEIVFGDESELGWGSQYS
jgi:hypothetical protein